MQPSDGLILANGLRSEGHLVIFLAIQTHLSRPLSPRYRLPQPTPERVLVADHRSTTGFTTLAPILISFSCSVVRPPRSASMSALGQKRTFSDTLSNVRYWGQSGHKTDPPPASRCAITSPRPRELIFSGNLRRGKQGRACRFDFLLGKVDQLVVATESAMRWGMLGRRFARAESCESGMGRTHCTGPYQPRKISRSRAFGRWDGGRDTWPAPKAVTQL